MLIDNGATAIMQAVQSPTEKVSVAGKVVQGIDAAVRDVSIAGMAVPYQAFIRGDWERLKMYFEENPDAVVSPLTVNKDTALHIAIYSGSTRLIESMIEITKQVARNLTRSPFLIDNEYGNTALHEAAASGNLRAAKQLLACERSLLEIKNKLGETPIYRAAAFGMTEMVKFLAGEVMKDTEVVVRTHRQKGPFMSIHGLRNDATSILHISVHAEHFGSLFLLEIYVTMNCFPGTTETALYLQRTDEALGELKDENGRTCLHLLANMRSAYKSGQPMGKLMGLFYNCKWKIY
ncbi:conserved hypothetical protein [Ricinus communis]|uniref:Uncharacterized protein n=1 Tax=Ricinus communis TaxID=3988 RepID=B9SK89_RICCO|nr:conserved hypothetical protein [Ricinus communis]